jgi:phospholipid/cholesterol/gamma-HCH transport system substrate-binding protein
VIRAHRDELLGLVGLLVVVGLVALCVAVYERAFTAAVTAVVDADRAGLALDDRSEVTLRGVTVGRVTAVTPRDGRARVTIAMDPGEARHIPANATAAIVAPTVLGPKFVDLRTPAHPGPPVTDGDVLRAAVVGPEFNDTFGGLMALLDRVDPADLGETLGTLSTALQGRGQRLGATLDDLDTVVAALDRSQPAIRTDLAAGADVAQGYGAAAGDLVRILDASPTTATTLLAENPTLVATLRSATRLGGDTRDLVTDNEGGVLDLLRASIPTADLFAEFAPTAPCVLAATDQLRRTLEPVIGGTRPGIGVLASVERGKPGYRTPADLPVVGARDPASCRGAPLPPAQTIYRHTPIADGVTTADRPAPPTVAVDARQLAVDLFGDDVLRFLPGAR